MQLQNLDIDWFLREIWQKKPLLIRNAFPNWENPIEPDDLAGLSCEEGVEARLITHLPKTDDWMLEHGPFPEERFTGLPKSHWTLLVQAVDHWAPEVADLIEPFRFLPDWRIDDVMVSYADDGGSVGPHFDQYDVFLIQGLGQRRWQIGPRCDHTTAVLDHPQLKLLAEFDATDEWILEPGDMLYVPPRFAHHGVAVGDECMTYSIGFRAPGQGELISHWADRVLEDIRDDDRFEDIELAQVNNPGEISAASLEKLRTLALQKLNDPDEFREWFGTWNTEPKYPDRDLSPERPTAGKTLLSRLKKYGTLHRQPASRFAFTRGNNSPQNHVLLFVDGRSYRDIDAALVAWLCAHRHWPQQYLAPWLNAPHHLQLVCDLFNQGSVYFDEPDID